MTGAIPLFELDPGIDRVALARQFADYGRVQIPSLLTKETARTVSHILTHQTHWGLAWQAGSDGPNSIAADALAHTPPDRLQEISNSMAAAMAANDYAFMFAHYPMLDAYLQKWNPGGPHDLLLEHLNDQPFLNLVRDITGIAKLAKADAQATLYAPRHFLAQHNDSHKAEGWRVAYVLNMCSTDWRPEWGGYLLFHDDSGNVTGGFRPTYNTLNLFAVPQHHQVSYVAPFAPRARYAITGWLRDR